MPRLERSVKSADNTQIVEPTERVEQLVETAHLPSNLLGRHLTGEQGTTTLLPPKPNPAITLPT